MKKLFHKICDVLNDINRLENRIDDLQKSIMENRIDDLQKSIMKNQALIRDIKKGIIGLYDDLEDNYEELTGMD